MEYIYKVIPWCYNNLKERDRIRNRVCLQGRFQNKKMIGGHKVEKNSFDKTMSYVMTAALLLGVSMPSSPAAAKKKAPKLSTKKVSISVGQKKRRLS